MTPPCPTNIIKYWEFTLSGKPPNSASKLEKITFVCISMSNLFKHMNKYLYIRVYANNLDGACFRRNCLDYVLIVKLLLGLCPPIL